MFASAARELEHPDKDTLQVPHVVRNFGSIQPRMTFNLHYFFVLWRPWNSYERKQKIIIKFNERRKM